MLTYDQDQAEGTSSEIAMLASLIDGDKQAFAYLYKKYSPDLYNSLLKMIKDVDIADELLQEVFVKVWVKRAQIATDGSFRGWLYRIAQNLVYDHFRTLARDQKMQEQLIEIYEGLYDLAEDFVIQEDRHEVLHRAIAELSPQRRQIFDLCRLQGKSYKEVAEMLGLSVSTVSNQLVNASKQVKNFVFYNSKEFLVFVIAVYLK